MTSVLNLSKQYLVAFNNGAFDDPAATADLRADAQAVADALALQVEKEVF